MNRFLTLNPQLELIGWGCFGGNVIESSPVEYKSLVNLTQFIYDFRDSRTPIDTQLSCFAKMTKLKKLHFLANPPNVEKILPALVKADAPIESMVLHKIVLGYVISYICRFKQLKELRFRKEYDYVDEDMVRLVERLPNLECLSVTSSCLELDQIRRFMEGESVARLKFVQFTLDLGENTQSRTILDILEKIANISTRRAIRTEIRMVVSEPIFCFRFPFCGLV